MKKVMIVGMLGVMLASSSLYAEGFAKLSKKPVGDNFLSVENGGSVNAYDSYSDGVGMFAVAGDDKIKIDNSVMNNAVFKKGKEAISNSSSLKDYLENESAGSSANLQVITASAGNAPQIGTPCDDGIDRTSNDMWIIDEMGNMTCVGQEVRKSNYCPGDAIGSEFTTSSGITYLVVDNSTIRANLNRASTLCTSNVTDMSYLFMFNSSFNEDISGWDVSSVTNMQGMFMSADSFNQNINGWFVGNVTDMSYMFFGTRSFNQPLDNWFTGMVSNMDYMFNGATKFNQNISMWNTSNLYSKDTLIYDFFAGSGLESNLSYLPHPF